jgi:hypothetical protein
VGPPFRRYVAGGLDGLGSSIVVTPAPHYTPPVLTLPTKGLTPGQARHVVQASVTLDVACAALKSVAFGVVTHVDMSRRGVYRRTSEHAALVVERLRCDT